MKKNGHYDSLGLLFSFSLLLREKINFPRRASLLTKHVTPVCNNIEHLAEQTFSTMVNEISYNTIALVIESWEQMKRSNNYEQVAGSLLFQQYVTQNSFGALNILLM